MDSLTSSALTKYADISLRDFSNLLNEKQPEAKRMELELARQARFNDLRADFWKLAADKKLSEKRLIEELLSAAGKAFENCWASYLRYESSKRSYQLDSIWVKPGWEQKGKIVLSEDIVKHYHGRRYYEFPEDVIPEHKEFIEDMMSRYQVKSCLMIPFSGEEYGADRLFIFGDSGEHRSWSEIELSILFELIQIITHRIEQESIDRALRASEQMFRTFVENANHIVYTLSTDGVLTYVSPTWKKLLGYDIEESVNQTFTMFIHPDDIPGCWETIETVFHSDTRISGKNYRIKHKNGIWRWHTINASPLKDEEGKTVSFLGIAYDISHKIEAEEILKQERKHFYELIENTPVMIAEIGRDGIIRYLNRKAEEESGLKRTDLLDKHILEAGLSDSTEHAKIIKAFLDLQDNREVRNLEIRYTSEEEELTLLEVNAIPLVDRHLISIRNVTAARLASEALKQAHDELEHQVEKRTVELKIKNEELNQEISERRKIEEELRTSRQMLRLVIDNVPQHIFWKDRDSVYLGCNRNFAEAAGVASHEEIVGKTDFDLAWKREEAESFIHSDRTVMDTGQPSIHIIRAQHQADGSVAWVDSNTVPLISPNGDVIGVLGTYEDITERLQQQKETKIREQQLVQADKMISLGILVAGIAHEINNPNQFIMSHLSPLKRACEEALPVLEKYSDMYGDFRIAGVNFSVMKKRLPSIFNNIMEGSKRIKNIVEELREYIREYPSEHTETIQFNSVVQSALTLLANLVKKSTKNFHVSYGNNLPFIKGHYQRLEQVVINLVQNACQALTKETDAIHIETLYDNTNDAVVLNVFDEGVGIPQNHIDHVTDLFFTTKRDIGGLGLGLAISSKIILDHGGKMVFKKREEGGTLASITLPVDATKTASESDQLEESSVLPFPGTGQEI